MQRLMELIFGLKSGFLSRPGEFSINFNPAWPGQATVGAATWNFLLATALSALVVWIFRRDGRTRRTRLILATLRGALFALLLVMLNRPVLTLGQSRTEPSVLAVLIDDSISMRVRDASPAAGANSQTRLSSAIDLLTGSDRKLIDDLAKIHTLKFYKFDSTASAIIGDEKAANDTLPEDNSAIASAIAKLEPVGQSTQLGESLRSALNELQGQRLAGVVLLTDGRDTPARPLAATLGTLKDAGVKLYPVPLGSEQPPSNVEIQTVTAQDAAFKGDIVNVKATVRSTGAAKNASPREVALHLRNKKTGETLLDAEGQPVEPKVTLENDVPTEVELQFKADNIGPLDVVVEADKLPGEIDEDDNIRTVQVEVLDAKISVLYVDGYPRWEYRYIKNEMIRDQSIDISCLLTSADPNFRQEGDKPITRFPENMDELMAYDVVLFGDVDPSQQFSDAQLQLVADFVSKKAGGFGMIAGPQYSPQRFRNTAIESILPVDISHVVIDDPRAMALTSGFRPILTKEGSSSSIFRFFAEKTRNAKFLTDEIQPIFWYARGLTAKRGVGEVLAEHPTDTGNDGHRAPILVLGHYGAGRTLFSAIDDSWRWRYYTGESIFDTYWVQQLRYLARSKRLGQRRLTFVASRPNYEVGQQVQATLRILDSQLIPQLPEQIGVEVLDGGNGSTQPSSQPTTQSTGGTVVRRENLIRQADSPDTYQLSFTAARAGRFTIKMPTVGPGLDPIEVPIDVSVPKLELAEPEVDRMTLSRLATETGGKLIEPANARVQLVTEIASAAKVIPLETSEPLWDAPIAMLLFVLLITSEWVLRKVFGMV